MIYYQVFPFILLGLMENILLAFNVRSIGKSLLNRITSEENEKIQHYCGNPPFSEEMGKPDMLIINGKATNRGKYPWAVSLYRASGYNRTFCAGTLISQRHVITAQHCLVEIVCKPENWDWWLQYVDFHVGGVCTAKDIANQCPEMDMKAIAVKRAISASSAWPDCERKEIPPEQQYQDIAIIELERDLLEMEPFTTSENIKVGCLSQQRTIPNEVQIYGWGFTHRSFDADGKNNESEQANHLMEIEMSVVNMTERPYRTYKRCHNLKTVCMRASNLEKSGAKGDSGTGIVGYHGGRPFIDGIYIAAINTRMWQLGIGLRTHAFLSEICYYTGVCHLKEWAQNPEEIQANDFIKLDKEYKYRGKSPY